MNNDHKTILVAVFQFLAGALISYATFKFYMWSAGRPILVETWIEIGQEALLLASALLFLFAALRVRQLEGGLWLVGGFLLTLFIRELDAWSDLIYRGSWKYIALVWLCALALIIFKRGCRQSIVAGLADYMRHRSYYLMLFGMVLLLVYSRLYGMKCLWELYATHQCVTWPNIKSFSEEAMELLAYMLIFWSSCLYVVDILKRRTEISGRSAELDH